MASVNGVGSNSPIQQIQSQPVQKRVAANPPAQVPASDRVELSGVTQALRALKNNDIRTDKVATIKAQIESGQYDKDGKKMDVAIDRLLDDLLS